MRHAHAHGVLFRWGGILDQPLHLVSALDLYRAGYLEGVKDRGTD